ncbi:membrane-associated protein VIPP1, chloroplastic isoform X3 [Physcomitrium patens]|uniref:membrane-associated protein VIPP1, chloroplastic isoform X3 n=1 Tax=Physcomitrium patens TaxID=3218 RepID=UPI000D17540C|nr:membrane-associated 30 kDa protein, chloroplastic-like isoform X3 [Physcomitrium patens]|eukprot:XP_024387716.1 membrane-associated 30 kDa protein, chloroplastic-like isoform X3 [Physcomitrella patens]
MGTTVAPALSLPCRSSLKRVTTSAHQSACPTTQFCTVNSVHRWNLQSAPGSILSSSSPLSISGGLRVGRSSRHLGSIRHAHNGDGGSVGGALASEMNIFSRIARIFRSYVEQFVGSSEDPERIIDQAVEDMNTDLVKLRQTAAQVVAAKRILENKFLAAQQASNEWYKRASIALEKGDEVLAREALKRRKAFADSAKSLKSQLDQQVSVSDRILSSTRILESKIYEARNKKDLLKARAQSAKTAKEVNEVLGSVDTTSALSAYKRMEEKVERLEAEADAITQMASDDLGSKFAQLEMDVDVDDDLKALKKNMLGSSSAAAKVSGELPPWENEVLRPDRRLKPEIFKQY